MAIKLGDAFVSFNADMTDLNKSVNKAVRGMKKDFGGLMDVSKTLGVAFTAIGGAIVGGLGLAAKQFADAGSAALEMSQKTGLSTEAVGKWGFALEQSGGSSETLMKAMNGMAKSMEAANQGGDKATEMYARLGFTFEQIKLMAPEERFKALSFAVAEIADPTERAALAMQVFGKSGTELLPVLADGAEGLNAMFNEAERAGAVFSGEQAALADQFGDAMDALSASMQGAGKEIIVTLVPTLIEMIDWIKQTVQAVTAWTAAHPELTGMLVKVGAAIGAVMVVLGPLLIVLPGLVTAFTAVSAALPAVGAALAALTGPIGLVIAAVVGLIAAGVAIYTHWEEVKNFLAETWDNIVGTAESALQTFGQVVGFGMRTVARFFTDPIGLITDAWAGIVGFFNSIWQGIVGVFEYGMSIVRGIIEELRAGINWVAGNIGLGVGQGAMGGIPGNARGTDNWRGGLTRINEQGGEILNLPRGTQIIPHDLSEQMVGGGGITININNPTVRNDRDLKEIAREVSKAINSGAMKAVRRRGVTPQWS